MTTAEAGTNLDTFTLPSLFCPFTTPKHPQAPTLEQRSIAWIDSVGLASCDQQRQDLIDTEAAHFAAHVIPSGPADRMQWFANWLYWFWAVDAHSDEGDASQDTAGFACLASRVVNLLATPVRAPQQDPLMEAARQIADAFATWSTPSQMRRWAEAQRTWLFGNIHQIAASEQRRMPSMDEYLSHRIPGSASGVAMAAVETITGRSLPPGRADTPRMLATVDSAALIISIDNDLLSYPLEQRAMSNPQNILNVLQRHHDATLDEAVKQATELRDTAMLRFLELCAAEEADGDAAVSVYLDALRGSINGNLTWSPTAPRYARHFPGGTVRVDIVSDTSAPDGPLPYSATAWWWNLNT